MLGDNYLTINNEAVPNPSAFAIGFTNIEAMKQSAAGGDIGIVTRLEKKTFTCSFQVTSYWLAKFLAYCNLAQCTLGYQGTSYTVRARITNQQLTPDSEHADRTNGLWTLSITFMEV